MEKREERERARSLARSPRPVRGPVRPPLAAHGGRRPSSRSRSPPSTPAVASAAPRRPVGVPLSRPAVSFRSVSLGGGARPFPRRGKGSAPRRRPAVAPGRSRLRARRVSSRRRSPLPRFRPRPLSGYLATASRRVGLKTPGGSPLRPRGRGDGGARRGPSRRLPRTPAPEAARRRRGVWEPPLGARGARLRVPGSPVRRRSRAPCLSVPTRFLVSCSRLSRWPARGEPLSGPPPPLRGRRVERGPCRRQHFFFRKEKNVRTTLSGGSLGSCVDEERS